MTITVYNATFTDAAGKKYHGSISSDKYTPKHLDATLCPHISAIETDYPIWKARTTNHRDGMLSLIAKMKKKATALKLTLTQEAETKYAPKDQLPDPTGKNVIIIAGEYAGQEGVCLGTSGEAGVFAVSPHSSNGILRLKFDAEFGILINRNQIAGRN